MTNTAELKANNIRKCIKVIFREKKITKPQLAIKTGLTSVTAHKFINELLERSVLKEDGLSSDGVGKKAVYYTINPSYAYIVGQNIYDGILTTTLFDFELKSIKTSSVSIPRTYSGEVFSTLCSEVSNVTDGIDSRRICGIGVTISGPVNYGEGIVANCVGMQGWDEIPLKKLMEGKLNIATFVENDINACVTALKWENGIDQNFVLIHITDGVGIGVWLGDDVFRGTNSYAGELAHIVIGKNGRKCRCGNYGCLETYASDEEIFELSGESDIERAADMALSGDENMMSLFREKSGYIAQIADIAVKAYDPGVLFIFSRWLKKFPALCGEVVDYVFKRTKWLTRNKININIIEQDNTFMTELGPAYLVLDSYIKNWR